MPEAKVTSKGQVTIPKEVREALHVDAGDRVQFFIRDDGAVELRPHTVDLKDLYGILESKRGGRSLSVDAMDEALKKAVVASLNRSARE